MSLYERSKAKKIMADKNEIQSMVLDTLDKMAKIVGSSMGPAGRPTIIERDGLSPLITKDGVTIAKSLGVDKPEANLIIEAAKEICLNTAKQAGDGTTTAIVLANAITKHGIEFLKNNSKYNPQRMVNELNQLYKDIIVPFLANNSKKISSDLEMQQVATISSNGDKEIADAVVKAVMAAGDDGTVLINEAQGQQLYVDTVDGYIVTSGLKDIGSLGPIFINDKSGQRVKMDKGVIFLYDGTINDLKVPGAIQEVLEQSTLMGSPMIVFAHGFSDTVLDRFAKTTKGGYTVVPVKTPMSGLPNAQSMFLYDMAAYTGATVYDPGTIQSFVDNDGEDGFGSFENAKIDMYECFIQSIPNDEKLEQRITELKALTIQAPNELHKMHLKAHLSKLTGGVSTIWVGGGSELEIREKKARVEDAVEAVKSAIAEGVVPGGCAIHLVLADMIMRNVELKPSSIIMVNALREPFELLLSNCGEDPADVWNALIPYIENKDVPPEMIFDANEHRLANPWEAGIIEPAKVVRVSIGNALSVASLLTTVGGLVCVPRNSDLENQLELSKQTFKDMMSGSGIGAE